MACSSPPRFEPTGPLELLSNIDDDDGDGLRDGLAAVFHANDNELLQVSVHTRCRGDFTLKLEPAEHLHVYEDERLVLGNKTASARLACGTHALAIEAVRTRSGVWNGRAQLSATTRETTVLELRVAPVVFPDVTRPVARVFAVDVAVAEAGANAALLDALRATKVPLVLSPGAEHFFERWMQDAVSAGVQGRGLTVLLQMDRPTGARGLEGFAATQLGHEVGLALPGRDEPTPLSYGGNVEVIPPHARFPLGRLVVGSAAGRAIGPSTLRWLGAQEAQAPVLELPTDWLETGHIDEVLAFVPTDGGWTGFIASPRLAWQTLRALDGGAVITRTGARQVSSLLADAPLERFNREATTRLDTLAATFKAETGHALVELPQLFEPNDAGLALALHPSLINLIALDEVVLTASSDVDGGVFEPVVRQHLGVPVRFVDAAGAYHQYGGGLHCGVEVQRR